MENIGNDYQDPASTNPAEEDNSNSEKIPLKNQAGSARKSGVPTVHYSDLHHFQRLVNEYQKNPEDLPR